MRIKNSDTARALRAERFIRAARRGDVTSVKALLPHVDPRASNDTPLRLAVQERRLDVIKVLVKAGCRSDFALQHAVTSNWADVVKVFAENGAVSAEQAEWAFAYVSGREDWLCFDRVVLALVEAGFPWKKVYMLARDLDRLALLPQAEAQAEAVEILTARIVKKELVG